MTTRFFSPSPGEACEPGRSTEKIGDSIVMQQKIANSFCHHKNGALKTFVFVFLFNNHQNNLLILTKKDKKCTPKKRVLFQNQWTKIKSEKISDIGNSI
jgi:hypothetical protein